MNLLAFSFIGKTNFWLLSVNPKGNQSWIFIGRTDAEAEAPILWPPDENRLIGRDTDAGKDWGQEEKGMTEDEMVGWHHQLNGHEFEQSPGDGEGQRNLMYCLPWGHKELDTTEQLNNNNETTWVRPAFTTLFKVSAPLVFFIFFTTLDSIYDIQLRYKKWENDNIAPSRLDSECPEQTRPSSLEEWLAHSSFSLCISICWLSGCPVLTGCVRMSLHTLL